MDMDAAHGQIAAFIDGNGEWKRPASTLREWVAERPDPGRYHLYVSLACPWASRTLIVRKLKWLEDLLPVTVVDPIRDERGWHFTAEDPDPAGATFLSELYERTIPGYDDRVNVPVLWDTVEQRIVNNESSDLLRMMGGWSDDGPDLYPASHAADIDAVNDRIYEGLNNGVYRAGFATTQTAYEHGATDVFATLDWLAGRLEQSRWLIPGLDAPTEADWRTFVTLVRFDAVYHGHFKCNRYTISSRPVLEGYLRDLYQQPGIAETVDIDHIKRHYYVTHGQINPSRIVPIGPDLHLDGPHDRASLS